LDAVAGLLTTSILTLPGFVAMAAFVLMAGWADSRRLGLLRRRLRNLIPGISLLFLILDFLLLAPSFLVALTHLFLVLLAYKLFDLDGHRDILWIYILTFTLLFIAATQTTSVAFLGVFIGYLSFGTWSWILFHLKRETEAGLPGEGPAMLEGTRLVTPWFMASSLCLALGCFLITLTLFFLIPRVGLTVGAGTAQRGVRTSGYADRVTLGASGPIQLDSTVVMRVAFPRGPDHPERLAAVRWRGGGLDTFNGTSWYQSEFRLRPISERSGKEFTIFYPTPGQPVLVQEIFLEPIGGKQLFAAPRLLGLSGPFSGLHVDSGDGIAAPGEIARPLRYLAYSQLGPQRPEGIRAASSISPPEISERYLSLPAVSPRVAALARQIAGVASTRYDAALRVEQYLTTEFVYHLGVTPTPGADPLEDFLFTQRRGHCEYFAASMAVILRILGVPSRVVTGFQRGEWNELGRFYTVRQRDAHSWVEAYFPGSGWVAFDPSPRREFESRAFKPDGWINKAVEVLRMRWTRYVIDYNLGDQVLIAASLRRQFQGSGSALARAWERWSVGGQRLLREPVWSVALLAVGLGLIALLLVRLRRGATLPFFVNKRPKRWVAFYERMLRLLARRGIARRPASTAREFAESFGEHQALHGPVAEITVLYERVRFGQERLTPADERRAAEVLDTIRSVTRQGRPARVLTPL
jgi:transglutaminase-like putative cysteine protease